MRAEDTVLTIINLMGNSAHIVIREPMETDSSSKTDSVFLRVAS